MLWRHHSKICDWTWCLTVHRRGTIVSLNGVHHCVACQKNTNTEKNRTNLAYEISGCCVPDFEFDSVWLDFDTCMITRFEGMNRETSESASSLWGVLVILKILLLYSSTFDSREPNLQILPTSHFFGRFSSRTQKSGSTTGSWGRWINRHPTSTTTTSTYLEIDRDWYRNNDTATPTTN